MLASGGQRLACVASPYADRGAIALACQPGWRSSSSKRSSSPRRSARRTCRTCRSASRRSARRSSSELQRQQLRGLRADAAERDHGAGCGGGYGAGAGFAAVYMRGVATGGDGKAIGLAAERRHVPRRAADHDDPGRARHPLYDIARVEALAGPQGTLYGASSQAGTIRIITNKPDPTGFAAGYALEAQHGRRRRSGYVAEGFVNVPIGEQRRDPPRRLGPRRRRLGRQRAARHAHRIRRADQSATIRHDDITVNNDEFAEDDYNTIDTYGARAALRVDLNDNWTITPTFMTQNQYSDGSWGDDLNDFVGCPATTLSRTSRTSTPTTSGGRPGSRSKATSATSTSSYSGNYLDRQVEASFDYSDYSFFYDSILLRPGTSRACSSNNARQIAIDPPRASLLQRRRVHEAEPRAAHQLAAGQARARSARLLLAGAEARLLPALRRRKVSRTSCCPNQGANPRVRGHRLPEQHGSQGHRRGRVRQRELRHHGAARADGRHTLLQGRDDREGILRLRTGLQPGSRARHSDPRRRAGRAGQLRRTAATARSSTDRAGLVAQRRVALPVAGRPSRTSRASTSTARSRATTTSAAST